MQTGFQILVRLFESKAICGAAMFTYESVRLGL